jgi:peptidyl-tRNA hydrolase
MYIFVNKGLGMSAGKLASQAAHAAVEAFQISQPRLIAAWNRGGHYTKLVMEATDEEQMRTIERYLNDRQVKTKLIIDEGMTEIEPHRVTALGCEIVDKDEGDREEVFSTFKLYRDAVKITVEMER